MSIVNSLNPVVDFFKPIAWTKELLGPEQYKLKNEAMTFIEKTTNFLDSDLINNVTLLDKEVISSIFGELLNSFSLETQGKYPNIVEMIKNAKTATLALAEKVQGSTQGLLSRKRPLSQTSTVPPKKAASDVPPTVTPKMVTSLEISGTCYETCPCQHECKITLADGRQSTKRLFSRDIATIANAIDPESIQGAWDEVHFTTKQPVDRNVPQRSAQEVLTKLFSEVLP